MAVLHWLYANVLGQLIASVLAFTGGYLWKIRPHHKDVESWIGGVHDRLDAAGVPDVGQPVQTGAHWHTETFEAVSDGR